MPRSLNANVFVNGNWYGPGQVPPAEVAELITNPKVWDGMMAFYREYEQIPRVIPAAEMMTNEFLPGVKK